MFTVGLPQPSQPVSRRWRITGWLLAAVWPSPTLNATAPVDPSSLIVRSVTLAIVGAVFTAVVEIDMGPTAIDPVAAVVLTHQLPRLVAEACSLRKA